ncbi:uncharacterized protein LOC108272847 isoform X2 [Ictalurus punctatus]|uniref:Uncharacterized protein LOC108272847 isoform X2 n=1 Tax=Ictalurus punctatus TaxID=7998 RepID=A0A9F7TMH3_ICTPU|nr:uncharacterized protein LOC108272847 isoform X2 [Ictalurus punctatus]
MTPIQVNKSCDELYMGGKYNYSTSLHCEDPEINWKSLDEIALGQERFLIRDYCESGIQCTVTCTNPVNEMEYIFNVFNSSTPTTEAANVYGTQINTIISIVISIIVVAILIVGLIVGMCYRKRRSDIPLEDITERNTEGEAQVNTSNTESVDPGDVSANRFMNGDVRTEEARPLRLHPYS